MSNTRKFPVTMARSRRLQMGVQLRVEPPEHAYRMTSLPGTRACGGCGFHVCSCPLVSAKDDYLGKLLGSDAWQQRLVDRAKLSIEHSVYGFGPHNKCVQAGCAICNRAAQPIATYPSLLQATAPGSYRYETVATIPAKPAEPAADPLRVQVGDVWRHRDGCEHRVTRVSGIYADLEPGCHCITLGERMTPFRDCWTLVSRATPAPDWRGVYDEMAARVSKPAPVLLDCGHAMTRDTARVYMGADGRYSCEACAVQPAPDWRACTDAESALRAAGFVNVGGSAYTPGGASIDAGPCTWRSLTGWRGRRTPDDGHGIGACYGDDWRAAIAHALGVAVESA